MRSFSNKISLLLALSVLPGLAFAQTSAEKAAAAEVLFREGKTLLGEGKINEACEKFAVSQNLDPALGTLMNLADCYERAGRTASAWVEFLNAATQARRAQQADRAEVADKRAAGLERRLVRMIINVPADVKVEGLEIRRSGSLVDPAVWNAPMPVDPGKHVLSASAPGKIAWTLTVEAQGEGKVVTFSVPKLEAVATPEPVLSAAPALTASSAPVVPIAPEPPPPIVPVSNIQTNLGIVVSGVGLLSVGAGVIFGLSARSKWKDADCPSNICPTVARQQSAEDGHSYANYSTATFVGGGVLLATGLTLILTAPPSGPSGKTAANQSKAITILPSTDGNNASMFVYGKF